MLLGLLLGNTSLRLGLYDGAGIVASEHVSWADLERNTTRVRNLLDRGPIAETVIGSVRDDLFPRLAPWLPGTLTRFAGRDFPIPIENRYEPPHTVGVDRLLNAVAARARAGCRGAVVVDFGTAISLSAVSSQGAFVGGLIAAGPRAMLLGLGQATPRLPAVDLIAPSRYLERQTIPALQAGLAWQVIGGVREMVRGLGAELQPLAGAAGGPPEPPLVLATGGDAQLFAPFVPEIDDVIRDLTLEGLFLAYRRPG